jgi:predicted GIY-YIG superfamily endonuclease
MKVSRNQARKAKGARYTRSQRPVELVGISSEMTKSEAIKLEYRIKQLPADKKITELTKEGSEMTIKTELQAVNKDIKALSRKMEKLIKEFDKSQKVSVAKKPTVKTTKRVPAKKAPSKKRPAKLTATDKVLKIISKSKRGIDPPTLRKKTGFDDRKITNILHRAFKEGKIKRVGRGIYVGA